MNKKFVFSVLGLGLGISIFQMVPLAANAATPTISSISPTSVTAGGPPFILTLMGTNFVQGSLIYINGAPRGTTVISPTQVSASIASSDISNAGSLAVTVISPAPDGGTSNTQTLTVTGSSAQTLAPVIANISPASRTQGSAGSSITINGSNFVSGSQANFNGSSRTVTYISASQLIMSITTTDLATLGNHSITVVNPPPGGGASNSVVFSVVAQGTPTTPALPNTGFGPFDAINWKIITLMVLMLCLGTFSGLALFPKKK